jgi:hypothetical protein
MGHPGKVYAAALAADGKTIVVGDSDRTARLWHAATRTPLGPPRRHHAEVWAAAFGPDGQTVVTGSNDDFTRGPGEAQLWVAPVPLRGEVERIKLWTQTITGMELDDDNVVQVLDTRTWQQRRQRLEQTGGPPREETLLHPGTRQTRQAAGRQARQVRQD